MSAKLRKLVELAARSGDARSGIGALLPEKDNLGFYNKAKALTERNPQFKQRGDQWKNYFVKQGLTEDELEFRGLKELLQQKTVTKDEIIDRIEETNFELEEVVYDYRDYTGPRNADVRFEREINLIPYDDLDLYGDYRNYFNETGIEILPDILNRDQSIGTMNFYGDNNLSERGKEVFLRILRDNDIPLAETGYTENQLAVFDMPQFSFVPGDVTRVLDKVRNGTLSMKLEDQVILNRYAMFNPTQMIRTMLKLDNISDADRELVQDYMQGKNVDLSYLDNTSLEQEIYEIGNEYGRYVYSDDPYYIISFDKITKNAEGQEIDREGFGLRAVGNESMGFFPEGGVGIRANFRGDEGTGYSQLDIYDRFAVADRIQELAIDEGDFTAGFEPDEFGEGFEAINPNAPKHESITMPGGTNYREFVLRLPDSYTGGRVFYQNTAHFDDTNPVVHYRVKDRMGPNGEKVLFVEEIQGDANVAATRRDKDPKTGKTKPGTERGFRDLKLLEDIQIESFDLVDDVFEKNYPKSEEFEEVLSSYTGGSNMLNRGINYRQAIRQDLQDLTDAYDLKKETLDNLFYFADVLFENHKFLRETDLTGQGFLDEIAARPDPAERPLPFQTYSSDSLISSPVAGGITNMGNLATAVRNTKLDLARSNLIGKVKLMEAADPEFLEFGPVGFDFGFFEEKLGEALFSRRMSAAKSDVVEKKSLAQEADLVFGALRNKLFLEANKLFDFSPENKSAYLKMLEKDLKPLVEDALNESDQAYKELLEKAATIDYSPYTGTRSPISFYAEVLQSPDFDISRAQSPARQARQIQQTLAKQRDAVEALPFITDAEKVTRVAMKRILQRAVDEGYDAVAFTDAEEVMRRTGDRPDLEKAFNNQYEIRIPKIARQLTGQPISKDINGLPFILGDDLDGLGKSFNIINLREPDSKGLTVKDKIGIGQSLYSNIPISTITLAGLTGLGASQSPDVMAQELISDEFQMTLPAEKAEQSEIDAAAGLSGLMLPALSDQKTVLKSLTENIYGAGEVAYEGLSDLLLEPLMGMAGAEFAFERGATPEEIEEARKRTIGLVDFETQSPRGRELKESALKGLGSLGEYLMEPTRDYDPYYLKALFQEGLVPAAEAVTEAGLGIIGLDPRDTPEQEEKRKEAARPVIEAIQPI